MKLKKFPAAIMAAIMVLSSVACNPTDGNDGKDETEGFVSERMICGFENYAEIYDFHASGTFKLDFNDDKQFVSQGEHSVLLGVDERDANVVTSNTFGVKLYTNDGTKNYRDFSKVASVTYDVFNQSESEMQINTSLMQKKIGYMYSNPQSTTVAAGEKATITYNVNPYEIYYSLGIDEATHVNVTVTGKNPKAYFDNMVIHYKEEGFTAPNVSIEGNNILDFEKAYHTFVTYTTGLTLKTEVKTDVANASEGSRYVRVYRDGIADGTVKWAGGKFGISAKYLSNYNFANPSKVNSYFAFDYKTDWVSSTTMWVVLRMVAIESGAYLNSKGTGLVCDRQWHTLYIPFNKMPLLFDNFEVSFDGGSYGDVLFDNFRVADELPDEVKALSETERNKVVIQTWGTT